MTSKSTTTTITKSNSTFTSSATYNTTTTTSTTRSSVFKHLNDKLTMGTMQVVSLFISKMRKSSKQEMKSQCQPAEESLNESKSD